MMEAIERGVAAAGGCITLVYVRPVGDEVTELDRRVGLVAQRYARWVVLKVVQPAELPDLRDGGDIGPLIGCRSPAVLLLRQGEVVSEAVGALLPARELDAAVRRAVEWPVPA